MNCEIIEYLGQEINFFYLDDYDFPFLEELAEEIKLIHKFTK